MPPADLFLRHLARFQRRLWLVTSADYTVKSIAVAIAVTDVLVLIFAPSARWTAVSLAASVVVGVVAAVAVARRRAGVSQTAALLDRRLALDDQIATALQFRTDTDVVSDLIVRRAAEVLAGQPSTILPIESPRARWVIASVAGAVVFAIAIDRTPVDSDIVAQIDASTVEPSNRISLPRGSSREGRASEGAKASAERNDVRNAKASAEQNDLRSAKASAEQNDLPSAKASADRPSANADRSAEASARRRVPPMQLPATDAASAIGTPRRPGNGARDAGVSRKAAGHGGAAWGGSGRESGGVTWSPTTGTAERSADIGDSNRPYGERYRAGKAAADAAVAQGRVPVRYQTLIHDYFQAIRPRADR